MNAPNKPKAPPVPKTLAGCADEVYKVREERYALQRKVKELEEREAQLRDHLINHLPKSAATGVAGRTARVSVGTKTVYQVKDWEQLYAWVVDAHLKHKRRKDGQEWAPFAALQKRLGEGLAKEMDAAGDALPGTESLDVPVLSITKV